MHNNFLLSVQDHSLEKKKIFHFIMKPLLTTFMVKYTNIVIQKSNKNYIYYLNIFYKLF